MTIGGLLLIPHELLHVLSFRLIGRPYTYKLGDRRVIPVETLSKRERLVVLLFPFAVNGALWLALSAAFLVTLILLAPPDPYYLHAPRWHMGLLAAQITVGAYVWVAAGDLWNAYRLLRQC